MVTNSVLFAIVACCWGDAAEVAVFESMGVAAQADDFGVVDEPVDHGGGDVAEDFSPAGSANTVCTTAPTPS